ncbi:MAG: CheD chemotactic sensory transduction, partial [Pseudomonadota bacterium]
AKIFGGAAINIDQEFGVGAQNIKVAQDILTDFNISIITHDVGLNKGRKIILSSVDGSVFVRYSK